MKPFFITVIGSTGSGKTSFALELARLFPIEIVNADIGQMYKPFTIGVAQPTLKERSICMHHLFQTLEKPVDFSIAKYRKKITDLCKEIWSRKAIPVFVGGSTLYQRSLFFETQTSKDLTSGFNKSDNLYNSHLSSDMLWDHLNKVDPVRAASIHPNDFYRLSRALDIWQMTGVKPSCFTPKFDPIAPCGLAVFLKWPRDVLYERINKRTSEMLDTGWVDEVENLSPEWKAFAEHKGLLGYKELIDFLKNNQNQKSFPSEKVALIQQKTRNYAKRQETFFGKLQRQLFAHSWPNILSCNLTLCNLSLYIKQIESIYESLM